MTYVTNNRGKIHSNIKGHHQCENSLLPSSASSASSLSSASLRSHLTNRSSTWSPFSFLSLSFSIKRIHDHHDHHYHHPPHPQPPHDRPNKAIVHLVALLSFATQCFPQDWSKCFLENKSCILKFILGSLNLKVQLVLKGLEHLTCNPIVTYLCRKQDVLLFKFNLIHNMNIS